MHKIGAVMMEQLAVGAPMASNRIKSEKADFESVMSSAAGNASDKPAVSENAASKQDTKVSQTDDGAKYQAEGQKVQEVSDENIAKDAVVEDGNVNQEGVITDETISDVEQVISETVKDVLGIDDAALEDAMAVLGLTFIDLLNPESLQQLVVYVNDGTDVTDMLTSDVMMSEFNEIMETLSDIDWSDLTGMSKEEFIAAADSMLESMQGEEFLDSYVPASDVEIPVDESPVQEDNAARQLTVPQDNVESDEKTVEVVVEEKADTVTDTEKPATSGNSEDMPDEGFAKSQTETVMAKTETAVETNVVNGQFVQEFTQTITEVKQTAQPNVPQMQQMIEIVNQVVEKIRVSLGSDSTTMEMQLNPESLGKVYLSVAAKDGVMTASFMVQSEEAKAALESQMLTLRENLEQKELKVEAVEVTVSDFDFAKGGQADAEDGKEFSKGNGKQFMYDSGDGEDGTSATESEAEAVRRQVMLDSGSSVDLTA